MGDFHPLNISHTEHTRRKRLSYLTESTGCEAGLFSGASTGWPSHPEKCPNSSMLSGGKVVREALGSGGAGGWTRGLSGGRRKLGVFRLGLLEKRDVAVGVLPELEEIVVRGSCFGRISGQLVRPS